MRPRQSWQPMVWAAWAGLLVPLAGFGQAAPAAAAKTVWDGIFNKAQQERGSSAYTAHCSRCHGEDLNGARGVLRGAKFVDRWREDSLKSLYTLIRNTMPPGPRGTVSSAEYVDIVAYVLGANEFPAGAGELTAEELERIQFIGREGPQPVPDFALVTVVGCLAEGEDKRWRLKQASEPVRTRNPRESTEGEVAAARERAGGTHTFGLLDSENFPRELRAGHWMEGKGFLMRSPGNDRINLTWLQTLRETCPAPAAR